jgi:hypothetical protein
MASIVKKYALQAKGILAIDEDEECVGIENVDTGEFISLENLFADFMNKAVKLAVNYDEDYE